MRLAVLAALGVFALPAVARDEAMNRKPKGINMLTSAEIQSVSPALDRYTQDALLGDIWKRPAVAVAKDVFSERRIQAHQLPPVAPTLLPIEPVAEQQRAQRVAQDVGPVSPGLVQYTTDLLFHDLWLRPDLAPRDRSLVTLSALIASGQVAQVTFHLNKAMDNGLTKSQASEVLTHIAFYAGWPNAMSAVPVFKAVLEKREG